MSDKVYELPDHSVSLVWSSDEGKLARYNAKYDEWFDENGLNASSSSEVKHIVNKRPLPGRWKPWTPPTFPPRVKCPRRCWATHSEGRGVFVFFPNHVDRKFRPAFKEYSGFVEGSSLTDIVWIDKEEYEDELQGCTTHGDVSRPS